MIPPGGPYFKWPWEKVYKISVATQTMNMAVDPENADANKLRAWKLVVVHDVQHNVYHTFVLYPHVSHRKRQS